MRIDMGIDMEDLSKVSRKRVNFVMGEFHFLLKFSIVEQFLPFIKFKITIAISAVEISSKSFTFPNCYFKLSIQKVIKIKGIQFH